MTAEKVKNVAEKSLSHKDGELVMTLAEKLRNEGIQIGKKIAEEQRLCEAIELGNMSLDYMREYNKGLCEGLLEGVDLCLTLCFGDNSLKLMPVIRQIQDVDRLRSIMDIFNMAEGVSDIMIENGEFIMTLAEKLVNEGIQIGEQRGLCEAIELGLSLRFGDQSLKLMPFIQQIKNTDRLKSIKDAIKTVKDVSDIKAMVEN